MIDCMCTPSYDGLTMVYHADMAQMCLMVDDPGITKRIIKDMIAYGLELYPGRLTEIGKPSVTLEDNIFTVFLPCVIDGEKKKITASDTKVEAMKARGFDFHAVISGKDVYINKDSLTEEKKEAIFNQYGLKTFIETTGNRNLVLYDPTMFKVQEISRTPYLSYIGPPENMNVVLPYNCSSMYYMFSDSVVRKIDFTGCDLSNIITMEGAFKHSKVTFVGFGEQNMTKLVNMDSCFANCSKLVSVFMCYTKMPNLKTAKNCFYNCMFLRDIDIGLVEMKSLENVQSMFMLCCELERLELPEWHTTLKNANSMFRKCKSLILVTMPNVDFDNADCKDMFRGNMKFRLFVPGKFNINNCDTTNMFYVCNTLTNEQKTKDPVEIIMNMKKLVLQHVKQTSANEGLGTEESVEIDSVSNDVVENSNSVIEPEPISSFDDSNSSEVVQVKEDKVPIEEAVLKPEIQTEQVEQRLGKEEITKRVETAEPVEIPTEGLSQSDTSQSKTSLHELTLNDLSVEQKKKLKIAKKRGYDVYCIIRGRDVFINSKEWTPEKDDKLFSEYGVRFSKERGVYNPDIQLVQSFM